MTVKRLIAIAIIFIGALAGWMILGVSNLMRTTDTTTRLSSEIRTLYGGAVSINQPAVTYDRTVVAAVTNDSGKVTVQPQRMSYEVPLESSDIQVNLKVDYRRKGVLWFPTYRQDLVSVYGFSNPFNRPETLYFFATLDNSEAVYDDVHLRVNGREWGDIRPLLKRSRIPLVAAPGQTFRVELSYKTTGLETWFYNITPAYSEIGEINNFRLVLSTDFKGIDFPSGTMSPVKKEETKTGWDLTWEFRKTITGKDIGLIIPNRLNPGEIASRVTFFAPVSLLFYLFLLVVLSVVFKTEIHPMNYLFLAGAFFAFHLIFSYFSDHLNIYLTFAIASATSILLVSSYLRIFTPTKFAFVYSPIAQLVYLVAFAFSFFFKGTTGMILTVVSVLTLFLVMQITGRIDWAEVFRAGAKKPPDRVV